jgi:hypothetical protein
MKNKGKKMFAIMTSPDDLDILRNIFGESAQNEHAADHEFAKRVMKAVHRTRKKHGFKWVN